MKKRIFAFFTPLFVVFSGFAQSGTEFWFAPPDVTFSHNSPGGVPIYLNLSSFDDPATVTIDQPANPGFTPIVVVLGANASHQEDLTAFVGDLETTPTNTILNTGLRISATDTITAYYEVSNTNNADIFSLKGKSSLGKEFYIPLHKHEAFYNHSTYSAPHLAYASFDIVATVDNTVVTIYTPVDVDGIPALTSYSITLDQGETYSCGNTDTNLEFFPYLGTSEPIYSIPANHPSGAVVISDKDVAITIKDDSNHNPSGGCYDLLGDQIVPVHITGTEYIAVKGHLNATGDESVFILATENNTEVYIDGAATPVTTLFAGQTYRYDMDYLATSTDNSVYIVTSKPAYISHVTGFGCEEGQAVLPPLGCAGSEQISIIRSTAEAFYLNLMVRDGFEDDFNVTGPGTAVINAADFLTVPGTGGAWKAAQIQFNATEIPVNQAHLVSNDSAVFTLAIVNGGATSGCRYGFFSEYAAEILIDAGADMTVCANDTAQLAASISGGTSTGIWTTSGSGQFLPSDTDLNATYVPSPTDISAGSVNLLLTSTGNCTPVQDNMTLTITPAPTINAGVDVTVCENNADVNLSGGVTVSSGGIWSGGAGTFSPNNTSLITTYTPTAAEIASGLLTLTLESTGNGICNVETDMIQISFTDAPIVNAGTDLTLCANNATSVLGGIVTGAAGGTWSGGSGTFSPNVNALNASYSPTAGEVATGNITLTLTSIGNGLCNAVSDNILITYTPEPTVNAGADQVRCANNATISLNGSVTVASGVQWSGGLGVFSPDNMTLNATYTPTAAEIASGNITLTLTSTGNGNCLPVSDDMTISFTPAPTANAGLDASVCANNSDVALSGNVTVATGGLWSGGAGTFSPGSSSLITTYTPTAGEISAGTVTMTLTTAGNGTCNAVTDDMVITITDTPVVNAGTDQTACGNNADITLNGNVTDASGGVWTGGSGVFTPNASALNAVYTPTAVEIASGSVVLTLNSTGNGSCNAVTDNVTLTYTSSPTVNAGVDQSRCANNPNVSLNGSVTVATGGVWSGGLGVFSPSNTTLNATYLPTASEIASGSITLTLTSTGNGTCNPVSDDMVISFTTAPTVNAGSDVTVCANNSNATLSGIVTIATGGLWSGGGGSFSPGATSLTTTYTPTAGEISAGSVTMTLTTAGNGTCNAVTDDMVITITDAPVVSAGADQTACGNNADITLSGSVTGALAGVWTGGLGVFTPNASALNAVYTPTAVEIASGSVVLTLNSTGNGSCNAVTDNVTLTYTSSPTVNAGPDQTKCANNTNVSLNGSVNIATGGVWSGGLGVFSPSNTTLNATYLPTASEIASGSITLTLTSTGNGTCNPVSDDMVISFTTAPTANAGSDVTVCANNSAASLTGSVTIATGGLWSGGAGTFTPANTSLITTYTPTAAEISTGSVTMTLTTAGNGICNAVTDDMVITITDAPVVSAGTDQTACGNNSDITLNGSITGALGGVWSGGAGTFSPNANALNAVYTPTATEVISGAVVLTLTSTGNGICNAVSDNVTLTYTSEPTISAGADQTKCSNNPNTSLSANVTVATGVVWSGGLGVFSPSNTSLTPTYLPTASEIASGSITLTVTSTGNGTCTPVTDDILISFTPSPTVDAGLDVEVCENNSAVSLSGTITIATGGIWQGAGGVFSGGPTALITTYTPSSGEIAAGGVTLTLESTGNGNCLAVTDDIVITISDAPIANAGPNLTSCENNPNVNLAGSVQNATGGVWSGGGGSFNVSTTDLNAVYTPSAAEMVAGTASLVLTTTGNGTCAADADAVTISITDPPVVNAGPDQTLCSNNADISLNGTVLISTGGQWSGGLGVFTPNNASLNAVYSPTATEIASGSITLTLTSTGNGTCNSVSDDLTVTFTPGPTADAGFDINVCENNSDAVLSGVVSNAGGGQWGGGLGVFNPSNTDLNATYTPSSSEILAGIATLTLSTTGIGNCNVETDNVDIIISPIPNVNAGADQTICVDNLTIGLSGSISGITNTGIWSTSGTGIFVPNNTTLNASYIASAADSISGTVTLTLSSTNNQSCLPVNDDLVITILPAGFADAGNDQTVCGNNAAVALNGTISGGAVDGIWSTSGTGIFVPNATVLNPTYLPSNFDINSGSVDLTLTSNSCNSGFDEMMVLITPAPVVDAGSDTTVCAANLSVPLSGHIAGATTTGIWTTSGTGVFSPSDTDLNATYIASSADSANQGVIIYLTATNFGNCTSVTDSMILNIFPVGQVNAGVDQTLCANNADGLLTGTITNGASTGIWTSSGTGLFVPSNTTLNATYIPSAADITSGTISLVLEATNSCNFASDFMLINYTAAPEVDAGPDLSICGTNLTIGVVGSVNVATGGVWSTSGTGIFTPNNTNLSVAYNASGQDVTAGSATLYLTTTGNGNCLAEVDSTIVSISTGILIDAGQDQEVCSTGDFALLQGQVSNGSTTGVWTTLGTGTFLANDSLLNAQYHFTPADTLAGSVSLILTSTNNGTCAVVSDTVEITFGDGVYIDAGDDHFTCASGAQAVLDGFVSGGSITGQWTSLGAGVFVPNDSALNALYIPSPSDITNGNVNLVLTSTNNGDCETGIDTVLVTIEPVSQVSVGLDQNVCAEEDSVAVSAVLTNATTGFWASTGTGVFKPSPFDLNAFYEPSLFDVVNGSFKLFFTTNSEVACDPVSDTLDVNIIVPVTAGFENSETCEGIPLNFTDTSVVTAGNITDWLWNFGDGDSSMSQNPVHIFDKSGTYDVELKVRSSLGCESRTFSSVLIGAGPVANFSVTPLSPTIDNPVIFTDLSSQAVSYTWDFGDGSGTITDENATYTYTIPGFYTVEHSVTGNLGCSDTLIRVIEVRENEVFPPVLPTGFSPNNDGINDVLIVRGGPFQAIDFKVYNNWGNLIFETDDPETGWDGTWKGKLMPVRDYVYTVDAVTVEGEAYSITGTVSIIK